MVPLEAVRAPASIWYFQLDWRTPVSSTALRASEGKFCLLYDSQPACNRYREATHIDVVRVTKYSTKQTIVKKKESRHAAVNYLQKVEDCRSRSPENSKQVQKRISHAKWRTLCPGCLPRSQREPKINVILSSSTEGTQMKPTCQWLAEWARMQKCMPSD